MISRRIAFFTDSFHEVNGVALTSREFVAFAQRRSIPLLSVHAGPADREFQDGSVTTVEFQRGGLCWSLERDLKIDLLFWRHCERLRKALAAFRPDLVHITGPGDAGILGALLAYDLKVPLVASWHTNLHEFGARRLDRLLGFLPASLRSRATKWAERAALDQCVRFYQFAKLILAPNPELVDMLGQRTGRPSVLMTRGIDTDLFSPARRTRSDSNFVIGYVGRLSAEKNVRMLTEIESMLNAAGCHNCWFLIVGEGRERPWLRRTMERADLPGVLRGEDLARAYASMDVFVFPSSTDTFGNVVLEAMASGVPSIVTAEGGPKFLIIPEQSGLLATGAHGFTDAILRLRRDPELLARMSQEARAAAGRFSWDAVFEQVHRSYETLQFPTATIQVCNSPSPTGSSSVCTSCSTSR
jgi:phosphatidylinositol alpha 1,6-mannosyltransferase